MKPRRPSLGDVVRALPAWLLELPGYWFAFLSAVAASTSINLYTSERVGSVEMEGWRLLAATGLFLGTAVGGAMLGWRREAVEKEWEAAGRPRDELGRRLSFEARKLSRVVFGSLACLVAGIVLLSW